MVWGKAAAHFEFDWDCLGLWLIVWWIRRHAESGALVKFKLIDWLSLTEGLAGKIFIINNSLSGFRMGGFDVIERCRMRGHRTTSRTKSVWILNNFPEFSYSTRLPRLYQFAFFRGSIRKFLHFTLIVNHLIESWEEWVKSSLFLFVRSSHPDNSHSFSLELRRGKSFYHVKWLIAYHHRSTSTAISALCSDMNAQASELPAYVHVDKVGAMEGRKDGKLEKNIGRISLSLFSSLLWGLNPSQIS